MVDGHKISPAFFSHVCVQLAPSQMLHELKRARHPVPFFVRGEVTLWIRAIRPFLQDLTPGWFKIRTDGNTESTP